MIKGSGKVLKKDIKGEHLGYLYNKIYIHSNGVWDHIFVYYMHSSFQRSVSYTLYTLLSVASNCKLKLDLNILNYQNEIMIIKTLYKSYHFIKL